MSLQLWGAFLGGLAAAGLLLTAVWARSLRRADLAVRVLPYVRDLPQPARLARSGVETSATRGVFGPFLRSAADAVERVLGGSASVERHQNPAGGHLGAWRSGRLGRMLIGPGGLEPEGTEHGEYPPRLTQIGPADTGHGQHGEISGVRREHVVREIDGGQRRIDALRRGGLPRGSHRGLERPERLVEGGQRPPHQIAQHGVAPRQNTAGSCIVDGHRRLRPSLLEFRR